MSDPDQCSTTDIRKGLAEFLDEIKHWWFIAESVRRNNQDMVPMDIDRLTHFESVCAQTYAREYQSFNGVAPLARMPKFWKWCEDHRVLTPILMDILNREDQKFQDEVLQIRQARMHGSLKIGEWLRFAITTTAGKLSGSSDGPQRRGVV